MVTEPTRYFMVHLQKTAGTTLRDRFRATFPDAAIYPNSTDGRDKRLSVISLSHLLERWQARREEIRLVAGHFPLSTIELLDADFVTLSILRPPVERTLSYLRHQKKLNPADRERTLEEIYDDPFRFNGLIRNHMVRMFSIGADEMGPGDGVLTDVPDSEARLDRAMEAIAGLDGLALQPSFEEFWADFSHRHGLELGEPLRSNTTEPEEAPASLLERIREDNALDLELYAHAQRLVAGADGAGVSISEPGAPVAAVLERSAELEAQDWRAAIDLLTEANRVERHDEIEMALASLRYRAYDQLLGEAGRPAPERSRPSPAVGPSGLPEAELSGLSPEDVRAAIHTHGSLLVRGAVSREQAGELTAAIDAAFGAADAWGRAAGDPDRRASSWWSQLALDAPQKESLGRKWVRGAGGVLLCDAPRVLFDLLSLYDELGLRALVDAYLGGRPVLSGNKCTLRRVALEASGSWHQDGAFLGAGIRALNLWLTLTDCGVDAPGLDVVPHRFDGIVETGSDGSYFDWAASDDVVRGAAGGDGGVLRPHFGAGDMLLFDDLFLHRTAVSPEMTLPRYAIEMWSFAPTAYPSGHVPLVW